MNILFVIKSLKHFSYLSSVVSALDDNGHTVEMLFDRDWSKGCSSENVDLFLSHAKYSIWGWSEQRRDEYRNGLFRIREARSYLNYLRRNYGSDYYRNRWAKYSPGWAVKFGSVLKYWYRYFGDIENKFPSAQNIIGDLKRRNPDVVVVSPANHRFSEEIEYIKAAKFLNIPTAIIVLSWDNLTTKGVFHVLPERLMVWNESQKHEAVNIHGIDPGNVTITGAPFFDKWNVAEVTESRYEFCKRIGINSFKDFVLYLGSSRNIAKDETWLVSTISDLFPDLQILVRPHPANYRIYKDLPENVIVHPKKGSLPENQNDRSDFYNALKYCSFVFGINTSGMIDALINNKPVVTLLTDEYRKTQKEAIHFKHMQSTLYCCDSLDGLFRTISSLINGKDTMQVERERFVAQFIKNDAGKLAAETIINEGSHSRTRRWLGQGSQYQFQV